MPWSAEDAHRHKKGLSDDQASKWAKIANSVLERDGDEGKAVRVANAQVSKVAKLAQDAYSDGFVEAVSKGYTDERAHRIAYALAERVVDMEVSKHGSHDQGKHDPTTKDKTKKGTSSKSPADKLASVLEGAGKKVKNKVMQALEEETKRQRKLSDAFSKSDDEPDIESHVEFSKVDEDKQQVFGWAIVSKDASGELVIDRQGDVVTPEDVEKSAYDYVLHSREGGEMHINKGVSTMIESFVVTPEKLQAMGIVSKGEGAGVPIGWWVGYQITDEGVWKRVKDGTYTAFSVHGKGRRRPIAKLSEVAKSRLHTELGHAVTRGDDEAVEAIAKVLARAS